MFVVRLVRPHRGKRWEDLTVHWLREVKTIMHLEGLWGWTLFEIFRKKGRGSQQLDWGAFLYVVSKEELLCIYGERPTGIPWKEEHERKQWNKLKRLRDREYGLVVIECY